MASSRTLGAGLVRRAQIVLPAVASLTAPEIRARMELCGNTVRHGLNRFHARGLTGLEEEVRTGRPPTEFPRTPQRRPHRGADPTP